MKIGMIGLGRMGAGIAERLIAAGHSVVGFDASAAARTRAALRGVADAASPALMIAQLQTPRVLWMMVPAGRVTEEVFATVLPLLEAGDTIVDGGNAHYVDTLRRAGEAATRRVAYVDCGTSGGTAGQSDGYSLMVGGEADAVEALSPLFKALAPAADRGWGRVGPVGAGHYAKMVHNGIEYGMMQAYAEGFALLHREPDLAFDVRQVAEIWRHGSVVRSRLLDVVAAALADDPALQDVAPFVEDSGEGRWMVQEALRLEVATPVIALSLLQRLRSRDAESWGDRLLAAMRNRFGGHAMKPPG